MIIKEILKKNDKEYLYLYSDNGYKLRYGEIEYFDVIDDVNTNRTYIEVIPEEDENISIEEFIGLIEEVL